MQTTRSHLAAAAIGTLLVLAAPVSAAFAWLTVTDLGATDLARAIAVDASGNVAVAGVRQVDLTQVGHVVKYASSGGVLWNVQLPGAAARHALVVDPSGDFIVGTGSRATRLASADGSVVWQVFWTHPQIGSGVVLALDPSGDLVAAGFEGRVVKLDASNGSEIWSGDTGSSGALSIAIDPATGDAFVASCGIASSCDTALPQTHRVARLRGSDGVLLWQSADLGGSIRELAVTAAGDVVTAGGDVFKLAGADGSILWSAAGVGGSSVVLDGAGDAYLGGIHTGSFSSVVGFVVTKLAGIDGTELWRRTIAPSVPFGTNGRVHDVALDGSGGVIAAGALESQLTLAKLDAASGSVVWARRATSGRHFRNHAAAVAVAGGEIFAAGTISDAFAALQVSSAGTEIPHCGDGATVAPEECDDGNDTAGDGCENDCTITVCSSGHVISNAELVSSNLYLANPERMRFKGVLPFPVGRDEALAPHLSGAQVRIRRLPYGNVVALDLAGTPIPPESAGVCLERRDGWRATARKSTYRNKSGALDPPVCSAGSAQGLQQLSFSLKPSTGTTTVHLNTIGIGAGGGPLEVVIGADTTPSGCARVIFTSDQCEVVGRTSQQVSRVRCRNY